MNPEIAPEIAFDDFLKVDIRAGTVVDVQLFEKARKPAWKLWVDLGEKIGVKKSSAQITAHYAKEDLMGRQVAAVVNFPPRQIADFMSEILVLGFHDENGAIVLLEPERVVPNGERLC
ncbi:MAG: tRNA-binding protein [Parvularculaceae bacterium]